MNVMPGSSSNLLSTPQIIQIVRKMLAAIDPRLVNHGERVAWITRKIAEQGSLQSRFDMQKLFLLSLFHDVGAYRTEEIDRMVEFESNDVQNHSLYGYLFLKYMSPLADCAEAIRYHHTPYEIVSKTGCPWSEYAALIFLADRIDISVLTAAGDFSAEKLRLLVPKTFSPEYYSLFLKADAGHAIVDGLKSGRFAADIDQWSAQLAFTPQQAFEFLKMMVYLMDFRSTATVTHTINTSALALGIGERMHCSRQELDELFTAALLHDIGKIGIPQNILEFPGKLSDEKMEIMRTHVTKTGEMIHGIIDDRLEKIAVRHHEKLNGSGYPDHIKAADLTKQQRILAAADILSALTGNRSYKDAFPKAKTLSIMKSMMDKGELDPDAVTIIINDYDSIMKEMDISRTPLVAVFGRIEVEYQELTTPEDIAEL